MRPLQNSKAYKDNKRKIIKKKSAKKSSPAWSFHNDTSLENLEDINEALRITKLTRAAGSWKLLPKDSCEVYKERRRRDMKKEWIQRDRSISDESCYYSRRRGPKERRRKRNKKRKRHHSDSSVPSNTCSEYSTSASPFSTSDSDMDYEVYD